jgi:hypothetical protein
MLNLAFVYTKGGTESDIDDLSLSLDIGRVLLSGSWRSSSGEVFLFNMDLRNQMICAEIRRHLG